MVRSADPAGRAGAGAAGGDRAASGSGGGRAAAGSIEVRGFVPREQTAGVW